jgi:hypothetical protein
MHTPKNLSDEEEIDDQLGNMEDLGLWEGNEPIIDG